MRIQTLLAISLLAFQGTGSLGAIGIARINSPLFRASSAAALTTSTNQDTTVFEESLRLGQMSRADHESEIAKVDSAVLSRDVNLLTAMGDETEKTWGAAGGEQYGRLMAEISFRIANYFDNFALSQKYANLALTHADTFSIYLETQLLGHLTRNLAASRSGEDARAWEMERSAKAKLWLHAWQRLESEIDRGFDFSQRPSTVMPPEETGLPGGVAPDAITNPRLRAKYEEAIAADVKLTTERNRQLRLRELDPRLPQNAEDYLIRVYSQSPHRTAELREYLRTYGIDLVTSQRIVSEVEKRIESANLPATQTPPLHFIASPIDLASLTNNADLIVIGRVSLISNAGRATATLVIDKVVKGVADGPRTVDFEFFPNRGSFVYIKPEVFGMFFLKWNEAAGGYRVLDPTYPAVIAPANAVLSKEEGMERTVDVVGQVLLTSRLAEDRRVAVWVLRDALTDRATKLLRHGTNDGDSVVRMQSISALLNRDDIETLAIAERILLNPPVGTASYLLDNMSAALEGIKDPRAIPALQGLLQSSNSRTRLGAARSLRQMQVNEAVEGLVIALGDNDRDVRYQGVIGLAELTGQNQWALSIDSFASNEQKYLDHWKEWARTR